MRVFVLLALAALSGPALAGDGMPCDKVEYAKLKDSTRTELNEEYCSATSKAKLNQDLSSFESSAKARSAMSDARVSCIKAASDAEDMLRKKFKAPPPSCK